MVTNGTKAWLDLGWSRWFRVYSSLFNHLVFTCSTSSIMDQKDACGYSNMGPEISKHEIRKQVWDYLEKNDLALFPRPVHGRIPHFKGCEAAALKLSQMDEFRMASRIKVCPDKPQEGVRRIALQLQKEVIMPIPRLRSGLFVSLCPQKLRNKEIKYASTARGAKELGKAIGLDGVFTVDLLVVGSVAVSHQGFRIGKGEGFADLEYAILMEMGAINEHVSVITTVHDCQVFQNMPQTLFKEHDVMVDIIVTPTQVFRTSAKANRLTKCHGIIWSILSRQQVTRIPILDTIRKKYLADGRSCTLKTVASQFSLELCNIPKTTRVSQIKELLASKGIKPSSITWQGFAGVAVLHYRHIQGANQLTMNSVLSVLREIRVEGQVITVKVENS